ncbi:MAG: aldolase/citrate lyase family protein [Armatimonadota bacterium]|nr:aldolase/citrate lyase family protein [Armatimonadota bacterium]MCX7777706.1 aldolase/citrate lyase family protein [Armatimonadota bacterium]MDW8025465.1 aldolase/citrate lyase family protein [Armatimonadota bacterium]
MRHNTVKEKLKRCEATVGSWLSLGSPTASLIMARSGFEWLVIDTEHGQIGYDAMLHCIQAICLTECIPFVRVAWNDPMLIKRALDAGALGIVVPMVCNAQEAAAAVRATFFPPMGMRSAGGALAPNLHGSDYFRRANDEICLIVQIEHFMAVERSREILSVDGIDGCFIGPNDLAASLGLLHTNFRQEKSWLEAIERVLNVANEIGKPAGIHCADADEAIERINQGFKFVAISSELRLMSAAASSAIKQVMAQLSSQ